MRYDRDWPAAGPSTAKERRFPAKRGRRCPLDTAFGGPRGRGFRGGEKGARPGNSSVAAHTVSDHVVHFRAKDGTRPGGEREAAGPCPQSPQNYFLE